MKYLKKFESHSTDLIDVDKWENVKDLIQMEIMDRFNISGDMVSESIPRRYGENLLEPQLNIRIDNINESEEIIQACRDLHKRVFDMTGLFINVKWSSSMKNINISMNPYPNHHTVAIDFGLEKSNLESFYDYEKGYRCDFETALRIIEYLNKFYRFIYDSDLEIFKKSYEILQEKYEVGLVFWLIKFSQERYEQKLCFEFELDPEKKKAKDSYRPSFVFDTNHTESPILRLRMGMYSSKEVYYRNIIDFLNKSDLFV